MVAVPPAPPHAVDRPALRKRLDESLSRPVTLLVAPAGSGKSVLLAEWAATHAETAFVWISVDAADNDPVRLAQRLLHGLSAVGADVADLAGLVSAHGDSLGSSFLEALSEQMNELSGVVVVLDDFHNLSNANIIADLGAWADLLPPSGHLVLATRVDLPLAWNHHRVRGDLMELRSSELAFDEPESAELLYRIVGRHLGSDSVRALLERTEGWAVGLQLAGMTLRSYEEPDDFISQFSGSDRLVADYLSGEVLEAQSADRRAFLLAASVPDQICADLAGVLTGEPRPQLILEELERTSMFLVSLDAHREWFRFHHLFRDLLRFRLRALDPGVEARLLVAAAHWKLAQGEVPEGVEYLLRAKDWDGAIDVILGMGSGVYERGEMGTMIRWINELPDAARAASEPINLLLGALQLAEGHAGRAADTLQRVIVSPLSSPEGRVCAQVFLAGLAPWRHDTDNSVVVAERALSMLGGVDPAAIPNVMGLSDAQSLEAIALISGGRAHSYHGNFEAAREWIERALACPGGAYSLWRVSGLGSLALLEAWCANLERAEELATEALGHAQETGRLSDASTADAYLAKALVFLERGQPQLAALAHHEGTVRAERNRRTHLQWVSALELAQLQAARGLPDEATTTMLSAQRKLGAPPPPVVADLLLALRARILRLHGAVRQGQRLLGDPDSPSAPVAFELAATALTLGDAPTARKSLDGSPALSHPSEPLTMVQRLITLAWISDTEGAPDGARAYLHQAVSVGERHGIVEIFVHAGPAVARMVSALPDEHAPFRDAIRARAREVVGPAPDDILTEPLTNRELQILAYLPSRFTNAKLAERCYVSINTIKTHSAHIYRKLGVANRDEAVVRARALGLL